MPSKRKTISKNSKTKRSQSRQHPKHFLKVYWPYLPIIAVVLCGMIFGVAKPSRQTVQQPATLAYSTEMSITGLLNSTNEQRLNNGLSALKLNSTLNSSAQSKANDMLNRDYWAHNTPDGQEPWVFFDSAGYSYLKAGENLAYGFPTSDGTVIGWMNSPSHRANILDSSYTEVGFGFVNAENFVGTGQETIVVAHYGLPPETSTTVASQSQNTAPTSSPQTLNTQNEVNEAPTVVSEQDTVQEEPAEEGAPLSKDRINQPVTTESGNSEAVESKNITRLQSITRGNAPWSALALSIVGFIVVTAWLIKHAILVKRYLLRGEQFVAHHPLIDLTVVIVVAIAVYLSQSSGVVL